MDTVTTNQNRDTASEQKSLMHAIETRQGNGRLEARLEILARALEAQAESVQGAGQAHPWTPYVARTWRCKWAILSCALLGLALGFVFDAFRLKQYDAKGSLEMLDRSGLTLQTKALTSPLPVPAGQDISWSPKVAVLESDALLRRTVAKLGWPQTERLIKSPFKLPFSAGREAAVSQPSLLDDQLIAFRKRLTVKLERGTNLVTISFVSTDAALAAEAVNCLMDEYIRFDLDRRVEEIHRTKELLNQQLVDAKNQLRGSEAKLEDYARSRGLLTLGSNLTGEERVRLVEGALSSAAAARTAAESRFKSMASPPAASSGAALDPSLEQEQSRLSELKRELASLSVIYTPSHYRVQQLSAEVHQLENAITEAQHRSVLRSETDLSAASGNEHLLENEYQKSLRQLSEEASKAVEYDVRKREVESNRAVYDSILQAVQETNITSALEVASAGILEAASVPVYPSLPKTGLDPLLGFVAGAVLAIGVVVFLSLTDRKIRIDNVQQHLGTTPRYASVPSSSQPAGHNLALWRGFRNSKSEQALPQARSADSPAVREAIQSILISLQLKSPLRRFPSVILVTSPQTGEGKSFLASRIAALLPAEGRRVLLIDACFDNPQQHLSFAISNQAGLAQAIQSENRQAVRDEHTSRSQDEEDLIADAVQVTRISNLSLLPAGVAAGRDSGAAGRNKDGKKGRFASFASPAIASPSETPLLTVDTLTQLFTRLKSEFDVIVVDGPGVLLDPSVRIWAHVADAVLVVFNAGNTERSAAAETLKILNGDRVANVGVVLNSAAPRRLLRRTQPDAAAIEGLGLGAVGYQANRT